MLPDSLRRLAIVSELKDLLATDTPLDYLYRFVWRGVAQSPERFLKVSISAYHHIGVTDDVRQFMGRLRCVALRTWDEPSCPVDAACGCYGTS